MTSNFARVAVVPEEGVNARLPHLRKTSLLFTTLPVGLRSQTHRMLRMTIGCRGLSKKAQEPNRVVNGYIPVASRLHRPPWCTFRILILPARDLLLLSGQSDGIVTKIEDQLGMNPGVDRATIFGWAPFLRSILCTPLAAWMCLYNSVLGGRITRSQIPPPLASSSGISYITKILICTRVATTCELSLMICELSWLSAMSIRSYEELVAESTSLLNPNG